MKQYIHHTTAMLESLSADELRAVYTAATTALDMDLCLKIEALFIIDMTQGPSPLTRRIWDMTEDGRDDIDLINIEHRYASPDWAGDPALLDQMVDAGWLNWLGHCHYRVVKR